MKHILFSYLFLFCITNVTYGQGSNIDSLINRLNIESNASIKENILLEISEKFAYSKPDTSIYYGLKALEVIENNPKSKNKAYVHYLLGDAYLFVSSKLARDSFIKSIKEAKKDNNERIEYLSNAGLGAYYANYSNVDSSLYYNSIALEYFEQKQDTLALITCYQNMMSVYTDIDDDELTIEYGLKCINLFKNNQRTEVRGQIFIGLSYAYTNLGGKENEKEAEKYLNEAEKLAKKNNDNELLLYIYQVRGVNEFRKKNYLKAIPYVEKALEYAVVIKDEFNVSMSHYNLGTAYYKSNQKKKAEKHFNSIDQKFEKKRAYLYLALINSRINEKESLMYLAKYDSLNKLEKYNKDKELLIKYESLEKEKENLALTIDNKNKELENQRVNSIAQKNKFYLLLGIASFIIISALALFYFFYKRNQAKHKIDNLQKQALQLQLNPHFFFNALNSINTYVGDEESTKAKYYLSKFSKLMRLTLENSQVDYVTLEDELSFIENYMALEQMNNHIFDYKINVDDDLLDIEIPSMLLQPFIENSIEHAFVGLDTKGEIKIDISESNTNLVVSITDNGIGLSEAKIKSDHKSLAISILEERIKIYSKGKSKVEFNVPYPNQTNKGAQVIFSIPIAKF